MKKIGLDFIDKQIYRLKNKNSKIFNDKFIDRNVYDTSKIKKKLNKKKRKCLNWDDIKVYRSRNKPLFVKFKKRHE